MKRYALLSCLLPLLLQTAPLPAAGPLYTVEVIVFATGNPDDQGEQWPARTADSDAAGVYMDNRITSLPRTARSLAAVHSSLQRSGHQILLHRTWHQPAGRKSSGAYPVRSSGDNGPALDGFIRLLRGRYLHLEMDLTMSGKQRSHHPGGFAADPAPAAAYRLQEKRRVRQSELHYFDHPRFGVLARVTRVKTAAKPDTQDSREADTPPAGSESGT